jgi:hypothetical protein
MQREGSDKMRDRFGGVSVLIIGVKNRGRKGSARSSGKEARICDNSPRGRDNPRVWTAGNSCFPVITPVEESARLHGDGVHGNREPSVPVSRGHFVRGRTILRNGNPACEGRLENGSSDVYQKEFQLEVGPVP